AGDRSHMGFPGYVLQSDLLQSLAPVLTVRSDTFTIRAYGDVVNPVTQKVTGRVWCEAKVQRIPEPVSDAAQDPDADEMEAWIQAPGLFGRSFRVLSFVWLNEKDL